MPHLCIHGVVSERSIAHLKGTQIAVTVTPSIEEAIDENQ